MDFTEDARRNYRRLAGLDHLNESDDQWSRFQGHGESHRPGALTEREQKVDDEIEERGAGAPVKLKDQHADAKRRAKEHPGSKWGKHAAKLKKKMKGGQESVEDEEEVDEGMGGYDRAAKMRAKRKKMMKTRTPREDVEEDEEDEEDEVERIESSRYLTVTRPSFLTVTRPSFLKVTRF